MQNIPRIFYFLDKQKLDIDFNNIISTYEFPQQIFVLYLFI